jgi:hypothetical protein
MLDNVEIKVPNRSDCIQLQRTEEGGPLERTNLNPVIVVRSL